MAAKIVSAPKAPEPSDLNYDQIRAMYPVKLDVIRIHCKMADNAKRTLKAEELEFIKDSRKTDGDDGLAFMALRYVGNTLASRCEEIDADDINAASAAVLFFADHIRERGIRKSFETDALLMHFSRLAGVGGEFE